MRLHASSIYTCALALSTTALAANSARIILSPASSRNQGPPPTISAEQSALIYAQRLGLSDGLSIGDSSEETIDYLNKFGSHERRLFDDGEDEDRGRWIAVVEGVDDMQLILPPRYGDPSTAFTVENPPSSSQNAKLLEELAAHGSACRDCHEVNFKGIEGFEKDIVTVGKAHLIHITHLQDLLDAKHAPSSTTYQTALTRITDLLTALLDAPTTVTIALMPPSTPPSLFSRAPSTYGTAHLAKHKRSAHHARQQGSAGGRLDVNPDTNRQGVPTDLATDAGLAEPSDADNVTYINAAAAAQMNGNAPPQPPPVTSQQDRPANNGSVPRGILPACYSTLLDCQRTTFNCSGHGACRQKYSLDNDRCFACECVATKVEGRDKTIVWAGPACQKKDVSVPFWLLAGVTIGLVSTVGWGVGLLVSMGSEELPGVIGAGVSGPRQK